MSNQQETNDWDITRCSKPFCCQEDAEEYMTARNFDGMVLELKEPLHQHLHQRLLVCLLYTSPSPRDRTRSRMPSSA